MDPVAAVIIAFLPLVKEGLDLILEAAAGRKADHAQLVIDLQTWVDKCHATIAGLATAEAASDAEIDTEIGSGKL